MKKDLDYHAYQWCTAYNPEMDYKEKLSDYCPDDFTCTVFSYPNLLVDHVREFKELVSTKSSKKNAYALAFPAATAQAQNALLKICEEPVKNNYIFLISDMDLLPTLKSRLQAIDHGDENSDVSKEAEAFCKANQAERQKVADAYLKDGKDDPSEVIKFLEQVLSCAKDNVSTNDLLSLDKAVVLLKQKEISLKNTLGLFQTLI